MAEERRPTVGQRAKALAFGVVPGLAHIVVFDRTGTGALLFVLFVLGADGAVAGLYLIEERWAGDLYTAGCVVAGLTWLGAWLDVARLAIFRDYEKRAALRRELTAEGVRQYAAGHLKKAHGAFRRCLALDHRDPDLLFWYGCVNARLGRVRRARRAFHRCRKHDLESKWTFEVAREEALLAEPAPTGSPPSGG